MYKPISLLAALVLAAIPLTTQAQALDKNMQTLRDICVGLRTTLTEGDCQGTKQWYGELDYVRRTYGIASLNEDFVCPSDCPAQDSIGGHINFDLDYVREVANNCVQPRNFKPASRTRGGGAQVAHKVVPAGRQLNFCIKKCSGPLQLFIVAEHEDGLTMTITAGDEEVAVEYPVAGVCQAAWQQPSTYTDVHFSLCNSSSQDTYCYIAFHQPDLF